MTDADQPPQTEHPALERFAKMERGELGEFYAGWNAAIRALRAASEAQGWWMPESVDRLIVKRP